MDAKTRPFTPASALLLVGVQLCAAVGVLLLGGALSSGESVDAVFLAATPVVAPLVALYVGLVRYAPAESTAAALRLGRPPPGVWPLIGLALIFGLAASPVLVALEAQLASLIPAETLSPEVEAELRAAFDRPGAMLVMGYAQVVLVPLVDETLYRGFIQPRLMATVGTRRAFWVTLVFYAAAQLSPRLLPLALVVGLPLGIIALAAGSTWASFAAHLALGGAPFVAAALGVPFVDLDSGDAAIPVWAIGACAAIALAALAAIWRLRRR